MQAHAARTLIELALAQEHDSGSYARTLANRLAELQPDQGIHPTRTQQILRFVFQYVRHTADILDSLHHAAECAGLTDLASPMIRVLDDLMVLGGGLCTDERCLEEILDESFVIHRLIEEINQLCLDQDLAPLLTLDMTSANLVIRTLIGGTYAEELELIAHDAALGLLQQTQLLRQQPEWYRAWRQCSSHLGGAADFGRPFFPPAVSAVDWDTLQ